MVQKSFKKLFISALLNSPIHDEPLRAQQDCQKITPQPIIEFKSSYVKEAFFKDVKLTHKWWWGISGIVLMSLCSWQTQTPCKVSFTSIIDWRVVCRYGELLI